MSSNKTHKFKKRLVKENRRRKRAPVWIFAKTNRNVRESPKSNRNWRRDNIL